MKKTLTILSLFLLCLVQTVSAQYEGWLLSDHTPTNCSTHVLRTMHMSTQPDEGVCKVVLYYRPNSSSSFTIQQTTIKTYQTDAYTDQTVSQSGEYYSVVWYGWITPYGACYSGYSRVAGGVISVTVDNIPTSTFKVDGATVNTSTYLQTYACSPLQMTNMVLSGTGSNPAWKVSVTKVGSSIVATNNWVSGTLPASYDLKTLLLSNYGSNIQGEYNVSVSVKNGCSGKGGTTYSGLVKVNANPTATSACFQISINNPDQRQLWEVMAFSDDLRSHDDVVFMIAYILQHRAQHIMIRCRVAGQDKRARLREMVSDFFQDPLHPRSA